MKFEVTGTQAASPEPVAYLDGDGDLVIKAINRGVRAIALDNESGQAFVDLDWEPHEARNLAVFYPGDTVKITF